MYVEYSGILNSGFFRRLLLSEDETLFQKSSEFINRCNNKDVYKSVWRYTTSDFKNSEIIGPFFLDFDGDIDQNFCDLRRQVLQTMNWFREEWGISFCYQELYFSGHKGFHLLIQPEVFGVQASFSLNEQYKKLAELVVQECGCNDIDLKIYDRRRILRLPNSINSKSGLYKVSINRNQLIGTTLDELKEHALSPSSILPIRSKPVNQACRIWDKLFNTEIISDEKPIRSQIKNNNVLLPCVVKALQEGVFEGSRNNTCVALANALKQSNKDADEILKLMEDWNQLNVPPLSDNELVRAVKSGCDMAINDKKYGCPSMQTLNLCVEQSCTLWAKFWR